MKDKVLALGAAIFCIVAWLCGLACLAWGIKEGPAWVVPFAIVLLAVSPFVALIGMVVMILQLREKINKALTSNRGLRKKVNETLTSNRGLRKKVDELRALQKRVIRGAETMKRDSHARDVDLDAKMVIVAYKSGTQLSEIFTEHEAAQLISRFTETKHNYLTVVLLREFPQVLDSFGLSATRNLMKELRRTGFHEESAMLMSRIAGITDSEADRMALARQESDVRMFQGIDRADVDLGQRSIQPEPTKVLHMVGKALPETQTGYTLRTQYTVEAQKRSGLDPIVAVQAGVSETLYEDNHHYVHEGINYVLLGGPERIRTPWREWFNHNVESLAKVVEAERPAVIHAHSDFINVEIAQAVANAFGIPLVNETRGFWEESWLSRTLDREKWEDVDLVRSVTGLPSAYLNRQAREIELRSSSTAVVTLADVMKTHIQELAEHTDNPVRRIDIVPNAVSPNAFPVVSRSAELSAKLGITADTKVVGYISSIVEYEGIDTLVSAFAQFKQASSAEAGEGSAPVKLLIVGNGPVLPDLVNLAKRLDISDDVTFTGRVPHEEIIDYYSMIDLFVVPRRSSDVTKLVTPLKPFEAMSTGRPCIFSNVNALAEIAKQSQAPVLFEAGDATDLSDKISQLIFDDTTLQEMRARGAAWVRESRTWDSNADRYIRLYRDLGMKI